MLSPFRECFFNDIYFEGFPNKFINHKRPVIIDIGANVGYFSLYVFYHFPDASVYAFEPMPFNFQQLKLYREEYPQFDFQIYQTAIADREGKIHLYTSIKDAFTTKAGILSDGERTKAMEVPAETIGSFILKNEIFEIDLLKLDCEGSEYGILYNLTTQIYQRINAIVLETHPGKGANENTRDLEKFINNQGFKTETKQGRSEGYIWAWR